MSADGVGAVSVDSVSADTVLDVPTSVKARGCEEAIAKALPS